MLVTPDDAERLALAGSEGSVTLILRNPLDAEPVKTSGARVAALLGAPAPPPIERVVEGRKVRARGAAAAQARGPEALYRRDDSCGEAFRGGDPLMQPTRLVLAAALGVAVVAGTSAGLRAQASSPGLSVTPSASPAPAQPADRRSRWRRRQGAVGETFEKLTLTAGRSTVLATAFDITRIAVTNPAVADAVGGAAARGADRRQGAGHDQPDRLGRRRRADAVRRRRRAGVPTLQQQLAGAVPRRRHPGRASTTRRSSSRARVSSNAVMLRAGEIAAGAAPRKHKVINMLQLPGGSESQQVMLQVRFAEVNRTRADGAGHVALRRRARTCWRASTTQQFPAPDFDDNASRRTRSSGDWSSATS